MMLLLQLPFLALLLADLPLYHNQVRLILLCRPHRYHPMILGCL
jgi:hypothetical protein